MTFRRQLVVDAVDRVVTKWEDATLSGKVIKDWKAWAFRVAINAVKQIAAAHRKLIDPTDRALDAAELDGTTISGFQSRGLGAATRRTLLAAIRERRDFLVGRQCEVMVKLCGSDMSLHRAAKELGMSRYNLKRTFQSGLKRLGTLRR